jgi:hypothetical protein
MKIARLVLEISEREQTPHLYVSIHLLRWIVWFIGKGGNQCPYTNLYAKSVIMIFP